MRWCIRHTVTLPISAFEKMSKHVNDISNCFLCLDTKQGKRFGVSSGILRVLRYTAIFEKNMRNSTLNYLISDGSTAVTWPWTAAAATPELRRTVSARISSSSGILRVLGYTAIFENNMRNSTLNYLISDAHDDRHVDSAASAAEATCRRRAHYW